MIPGVASGQSSVEVIFSPDTSSPTITSSSSVSVAENEALLHSLTANESVTWSIVGGPDQEQFNIEGSTLTWSLNSSRDYEIPEDVGSDNSYLVTVRATDGSGNTVDQVITVSVTFVPEPSWTTVYSATGAVSAEVDTSDMNTRLIVLSADLTGGGTNKVRVTFRAPAAFGMDIQNAAIGKRGSGADYSGSPVALAFSGSAGASLLAGQSVVSDEATFSFLVSDSLLIAINHGATSAANGKSGVSLSNGQYAKAMAGDDTMNLAVSGYSFLGGSGNSWAVDTIETKG